jgi:hypothetical protein
MTLMGREFWGWRGNGHQRKRRRQEVSVRACCAVTSQNAVEICCSSMQHARPNSAIMTRPMLLGLPVSTPSRVRSALRRAEAGYRVRHGNFGDSRCRDGRVKFAILPTQRISVDWFEIQQNLDKTIWVITISGSNNDLPSVLVSFCGVFNDIPFITIIVRFCGPKAGIYNWYRYIYTDLYCLIPFMHITYLKP